MLVHAKTAATIGLLALVIGAAGAVILRRPASGPYRVHLDQAAVVKEMRRLGRLETASFTIEKIIEAGTAGSALKSILFGDRLLLVAHGEVIAGMDLAGLETKDIDVDDASIRLQLPAPAVLVTRLDNSLTKVYDRRQGLLTRGDKDLEAEARQAAEESITKAACDAHILEEASENAKKQLGAVLSGLGFTSIDVVVETPAQCP
jgi:hypothetical protein